MNAISNICPGPNRRRGEQNFCNQKKIIEFLEIQPSVYSKEWKFERIWMKTKRTSEVSLFGRALDVVSGFDYGNIQILYLAKRNPQNHNPILDNKKPTFFLPIFQLLE